jgi:hypothetical protein
MVVEDNSLTIPPRVITDVVCGGLPVLNKLNNITSKFSQMFNGLKHQL